MLLKNFSRPHSNCHILYKVCSILNLLFQFYTRVIRHYIYLLLAKQEKEQPLGQKPIEKFLNQQIDGKNTLIGAGGGALLGKVVLGTGWGAVFGAIAGTALVLYMATRTNEKQSIKTRITLRSFFKISAFI